MQINAKHKAHVALKHVPWPYLISAELTDLARCLEVVRSNSLDAETSAKISLLNSFKQSRLSSATKSTSAWKHAESACTMFDATASWCICSAALSGVEKRPGWQYQRLLLATTLVQTRATKKLVRPNRARSIATCAQEKPCGQNLCALS